MRAGDVGGVVRVLPPLADGAGQRAGARTGGRGKRAKPGRGGTPRRSRATQPRVYTHRYTNLILADLTRGCIACDTESTAFNWQYWISQVPATVSFPNNQRAPTSNVSDDQVYLSTIPRCKSFVADWTKNAYPQSCFLCCWYAQLPRY